MLLERHPKIDQNPLLEFKNRIGIVDIGQTSMAEIIQEFDKLEPGDPKLYEKLSGISKELKLTEKFLILCGKRYGDQNLAKVLKILGI